MSMLFVILIAVIIILVVENNSKKSQAHPSVDSPANGAGNQANFTGNPAVVALNQRSLEIQRLDGEIRAELDRAAPDYDKIKSLHAKIADLKALQQTELDRLSSAGADAANSTDAINNNIGDTAEVISVGSTLDSATPSVSTISNPQNSGLTIALYIGSLLILAGVAGLVMSGAKAFGLVLLIIMTIVFYGGGILLHKSQTLKMASYVFVGTGMLMLPFIGVLVYDTFTAARIIGDVVTGVTHAADPGLIWLIMSLIGVPMYLFAARIMKSKVFSYFAIAGFVSLSCSLAQVVNLSLVWYFVFVMALGVVMEILSLTPVGQKLGIMQDSVRQTGEWLPLATMVMSLTAMPALKELDYVIILGITLLHLALDYAFRRGITKETLLRLAVPAWLVVFLHYLFPNATTVGITLECAALGQILIAFYHLAAPDRQTKRRFKRQLKQQTNPQKSPHISTVASLKRQEVELAWVIISMVSFLVAGVCLGMGESNSWQSLWAWVSFSLGVDMLISFLIRYAMGQNTWLIGALITGLILPLTVINAIGSADFIDRGLPYFFIYLLEMVGAEALLWKAKNSEGDTLTAVFISIFGLAAAIGGANHRLAFAAFFAVALGYWLRGHHRQIEGFKEAAVYLVVVGAYFFTEWLDFSFNLGISTQIRLIIVAHLALLGFITTSILWDSKAPRLSNSQYPDELQRSDVSTDELSQAQYPRLRLAIGCIMLLVVVTGVAVSGAAVSSLSWVMYLFLVETVLVLLAGVIMKEVALRIAGAIGAFLAVLWFTRDLSFAWPIILGLGIIGTVVFILVKNGKSSARSAAATSDTPSGTSDALDSSSGSK